MIGKEIWYHSAGASLFAIEAGRGRPIIFLHGGLADHVASLLLVGPLARSYRIIAPDVRGSGRSIHHDALNWDQLADDVQALMCHLAIDEAVVGGASAGAAVALRFALRHPERTLGLVLVAPAFAGAQRGLTEAQQMAFARMKQLAQRSVHDGVEALHALFDHLPPPMREPAEDMASRFDPRSVAASARFLASGAQPFDAATELETLAAPTLVVAGEDEVHPAEVAALYAAHIPECVIVDQANTDVAKTIDGFCRSL